MNSIPTISIITVTYNNANVLASHWSEFKSGNSIEWIVVDNNSHDQSAKIAEHLGARVVALGDNLGFSTANNRGANIARGDYLFFVNPDVVVDVDHFEILRNELQEFGGLIAPQLIGSDGNLQPNGRGYPYLSWKVRHRLPFRWKGIGDYRKFADKGQIVDVPWLTGAVIGVTAEDFKRLNGWDEAYFLYYEDTDLSLRAHEMNMPVRVFGGVRWIHSWARETAGFSLKPWIRELTSAITFYRRYPKYLLPKL